MLLGCNTSIKVRIKFEDTKIVLSVVNLIVWKQSDSQPQYFSLHKAFSSMSSETVLNVQAALSNIEFFSAQRAGLRIALAVLTPPIFSGDEADSLKKAGVSAIWFLGKEAAPASIHDFDVVTAAKAHELVGTTDLLIAYDQRYWDVYQMIGMNKPLRDAAMAAELMIVPYASNADKYPMLPKEVLEGRQDVSDYRLNETIYQYISRNNLRGSYAEFGTWFGRSFYRSYMMLNEQLDGDFWAFDSFGGLPKSRDEEGEFTKGDFTEGRYFCNEASFRAIGSMLFTGDPKINDRIKIVKGFYSESLDGKTIADYGLEPESISYCSIDCDLYDATLSVLRFIEPALQNGAVIYLDDYRMARAAKEASLYHAVKVWLGENPNVELIDLHRDHWQHQYVIFNRY
jgi:Macrocin-O-methyltransferase (TylF)